VPVTVFIVLSLKHNRVFARDKYKECRYKLDTFWAVMENFQNFFGTGSGSGTAFLILAVPVPVLEPLFQFWRFRFRFWNRFFNFGGSGSGSGTGSGTGSSDKNFLAILMKKINLFS